MTPSVQTRQFHLPRRSSVPRLRQILCQGWLSKVHNTLAGTEEGTSNANSE